MKNKKIYQKWINFAKRDLKDAEILFNNKRYLGCIYHCHQAIEKTLKAILIAKRKNVPKIHDLLSLLKQSEIKYSKEVLNFIQELNPYYNPIRYPDLPATVSLKIRFQRAKRILKFTKITIKWLIFQHEK